MIKKIHNIVVICLSLLLPLCFPNHGNGQIPKVRLSFPENKTVVEIPFTRYRGWIIIKVSVNNTKERSFILDTGAPIAILANADLKDEMNLKIVGNVSVGGSDPNNPKSVPLAASIKFKVGDIVIENGLMAVGAASEAIDGVDGIIGKYLFDDAVVAINWKENKLILTRAENFTYNGTGETVPLHLLPSGHIYADINVEINGKKVPVKSEIDLGNRSNFYVYKELGDSIISNEKIIHNIIVSWGANGPVSGDITRTKVSIGSIRLENVLTAFSQTNKSIKQDGLEANIGLSILEKFTTIFDYTHKKLILEKTEKSGSAFTFNKSGIILNPKREAGYVLIADIIPSSPAQDKGLQKEDRILSINRKKIDQLTTDMIDDLIKGKSSDILELILLRNGKELTLNIKTRDII